MTHYVWLHVGVGRKTHAVRAPGRAQSMAVCGTSPVWYDPTGWLGFSGEAKTRAEKLDRCRRCKRITAGGDP